MQGLSKKDDRLDLRETSLKGMTNGLPSTLFSRVVSGVFS